MSLPTPDAPLKGHYVGTEIDGKWWKRYRKDGFLARGRGEYWLEDATLYFRRTLTKSPIAIPLSKVVDIAIGTSHAGKFLLGPRVIKLTWETEGMVLTSGFIMSKTREEATAIIAELESCVS